MVASDIKILLIKGTKISGNLIHDILKAQGFDLIIATNIESAIHNIINERPDIILSFFELNDLNGFQVFNILNKDFLNNEIPYIVIFNFFRKNELLVGIELGIDSFIFPPYDGDRIGKIIIKECSKNYARKTNDLLKFNSVCKLLPYGIFVADSKKIVETNESFEDLVQGCTNHNGTFYLNEVFEFRTDEDDELRFVRFLNGLSEASIFYNVGIKGDNKEYYDLYCSSTKRMSSTKIIGVLIPTKDSSQKGPAFISMATDSPKEEELLNPNILTSREQQILQLSATGCPVKQMAERLGISERTVEKHRSNIIRKAKAENIMEAVFLFSKTHLLIT